ncbi:MAG: hypothetical protein Q9170_004426 [Blastenia crenularia]
MTSTALYAESILQTLDSIVNIAQTKSRYNETDIDVIQWDEQRGRFRIWVADTGACQENQSALEFRLRDDSRLREEILKLLQSLRKQLDMASQIQSPEAGNMEEVPQDTFVDDDMPPMQRTYYFVSTTILCLSQMAILVKQPGQNDFLRSQELRDAKAFYPHPRNEGSWVHHMGRHLEEIAISVLPVEEGAKRGYTSDDVHDSSDYEGSSDDDEPPVDASSRPRSSSSSVDYEEDRCSLTSEEERKTVSTKFTDYSALGVSALSQGSGPEGLAIRSLKDDSTPIKSNAWKGKAVGHKPGKPEQNALNYPLTPHAHSGTDSLRHIDSSLHKSNNTKTYFLNSISKFLDRRAGVPWLETKEEHKELKEDELENLAKIVWTFKTLSDVENAERLRIQVERDHTLRVATATT